MFSRQPSSPTRLIGLTGAALVFAALLMAVALEEEPYHIDELRQTRSYSMSLGEIVERSFAQDQPPLDPLLNAFAQRALGEGDWQQRLLPAALALGGYAIFAILCFRYDIKRGMTAGIAVLALSPLLLSVFVYARPYALPFFLLMGFLLATDHWLRERSRLGAVFLVVSALLLPLSRTIEPNLALAFTALVLVVRALRNVDPHFSGSPWLPIGATFTGLLGVGLPVFLRLRSQLTAYTDQGLMPSSEQLSRLVTDVPQGLAEATPLWPVALALVLTAAVVRGVRRKLAAMWWFWVLASVPISFTTVFVLTTDPGQPLYDRYFFTWVPVLALIVSVLVEQALEQRGERIAASAVIIGATTLILGAGWATAGALTTVERGDWKALSEVIASETQAETVVILESIRPLGSYRTPFAGKPRYIERTRSLPHTPEVILNPSVVGDDEPIALVISGSQVDVDGWSRIPVDNFFSLYLPDADLRGPHAAGRALVDFGHAYPVDQGSTLMLAGASLLASSGDIIEACRALDPLLAQGPLGEEVRRLIDSGMAPALRPGC